MALDFPSTPNVGDQFTSGGVIWIWDGAKWTAGGVSEQYLPLVGGSMSGPIILAGDPTTNLQATTKQYVDAINPSGRYLPLAGGTLTGALVCNSAMIAQSGFASSTGGAPPTVINGPNPGDNSQAIPPTSWVNAAISAALSGRQNRNRLINGNFLCDQWNNYVIITPSANAKVSDRWTLGMTQPSKFTSQSVASGFSGIGRTMRIATAAAYTSLVTDAFYLYQGFEYLNVADFQGGSAAAATVTLSFMAYASVAGTYSGSLQGNQSSGAPASYRSYPFTFTLAAAVWTPVTVVIPLDTSAWSPPAAVTSLAMYLFFDLGSGTNYRAPAGAWATGNFLGANGAASLVATAGAVFLISNIQLELGAQATPFDFRSYGEELMLCKRYYQAISFILLAPVANVANFGGAVASINYPVPMRAAPTASITLGTSGGPWVGTAQVGPGVSSCTVQASAMQTAAGAYITGGIALNAEL